VTTSTTPKKIILKGDPIYKERLRSTVSILPGMLLQVETDGSVKPHATAGGNASAMFAIEQPIYLGHGIDDAYDTTGAAVEYAFCRPGDEVYALLYAGTGGDVAIGDELMSDGAGGLKKYVAPAVAADVPVIGAPVARALEHIDNDPGVGGAQVRIKVEVL